MATYECLADLHGKILKCGDNVVLRGFLHVVHKSFLNCREFFNDKIFLKKSSSYNGLPFLIMFLLPFSSSE